MDTTSICVYCGLYGRYDVNTTRTATTTVTIKLAMLDRGARYIVVMEVSTCRVPSKKAREPEYTDEQFEMALLCGSDGAVFIWTDPGISQLLTLGILVSDFAQS